MSEILLATKITDGFNSGGSETCYSNASGSVGAGYDDVGRLVEFDCGSGNWGQQFAYDQFDNLTKTVLSGRTGTTWNPTYNTSNQCPSPCTYDSDGNMTADGNEVYGWNAFSKVAWTATSGTPTCGTSGRCATYDAFGRMVESSNNSTWHAYWYTQAGGVVMMSGATLSYAHWPTTHGIAELLDTTNFGYMPKDWIGNTRIVSNVGNHTVSADQSYTPYGEIYNIFGANNSQYQVFAGTIAELAPSTTTPIMWDTPNRELSYTGRWLSPDPAGVGWNQYAYPTNPNSFSDPSGLVWISQPGGGPYCMVAGPTPGAFHADAVETRCQNGNQGGDNGGDGEDPDDDSGFLGSDGFGDPFAGAGGPSISPLEGNLYDENVEAVVDGPGVNISGSVGADGGFIGAGVFAYQGVPGVVPDDPLDFPAYGDLNFGPCITYVMACGPVQANNGGAQQQQPKPPQQQPQKESYLDCVVGTAAEGAIGGAVANTAIAVTAPTVGFGVAGCTLGPEGCAAGAGLGFALGVEVTPIAAASGFVEGGSLGALWGAIRCAF